MSYPSREDYEHRDERTGPPQATNYSDDFARTGICPRHVSATDVAHVTCAICGHSDYLHPGFLNGHDPELTGCLVCWLKLVVRRYDARTHELEERP